MDSVIFYPPPASTDGHYSRSITPHSLTSSPLCKHPPSNLDSDDELPSFTDILSRARPVASRVPPQVIDLTIDSSDDVLCPPSLPRQISPARDLSSLGVGSSSLPAVHNTLVATPPRKSPFKNRPSWAIRKSTPEILLPVVEPVQQPTASGDAVDIFTKMAEICSKLADSHNDNVTSVVPTEGQEVPWLAGPENTLRRSDQSGINPQDVETDVGSTRVDRAVAPSSQHPAPMLHARDTWNTAIADSPSPEIADSDEATDKRPPPFVFDVPAEDDDGLVSDIQPRAKRRRRASSASSSVRTGQAPTPLVVKLSHEVGLEEISDLNRDETVDGHEWQAQRIVGERQTPSGLEYEVSVEKMLWLPRATIHAKLVRRYRAEQRATTRIRTRWSSRLQRAGSSVTQQP